MSVWLPALLSMVGSILAGSGLWTFLHRRDTTKTAMVRLLLGLAYDKIATLGMHYIERGWISKDEYEEFQKYLYQPYKDFGGNGVADQIMAQVSQLPLKSPNRYYQIADQARRTERETLNG